METIAQMKKHQHLIDGYREKTGLDVSEEEMAFTVWNYIDPKSSEILIQRGCILGKTFFPKARRISRTCIRRMKDVGAYRSMQRRQTEERRTTWTLEPWGQNALQMHLKNDQLKEVTT